MAVYIKTENPKQLLENIKSKLTELINPSWNIDFEGDFQYTGCYSDKAWLRPYFSPKNLIFGIIGKKNESLLKSTYSTYHAEIAKFILNHFDDDVISIKISPKKVISIDKFE